MGNDFELGAHAAAPPTITETVTAVIGLAAWTVVYCGARLVGGALAVGISIWRLRR